MKFRNSPFFAYYCGQAQAQCDKATINVFKPLDPSDPYAKEHREQLIGEAQAYLFLAAESEQDLCNLQRIVTEQQDQQNT